MTKSRTLSKEPQRWTSVAAFAADVTAGYTAPDGTVVSAGPVQFQAQSGAAFDELPAGWVPFGDVTINHFGAIPYANFTLAAVGVDASTAVQAAVDYVDGGPVKVLAGRYRLDSPILVAQRSGGFVGAGKFESYFVVTHTTGEAIRYTRDNPTFKDMGVASGGARSASAADETLCGIRVEVEDDPGGTDLRMRGCAFSNYDIRSQPGSGIVMVGAVTGLFDNGLVTNNKYHGYHIANRVFPRTENEGVPGLCVISSGNVTGNGGHAITTDPLVDFSTPATRITMVNVEINTNADDAAVRSYPAQLYLRGAQFTMMDSVVKPVVGDLDGVGFFVSGVGHVFSNIRVFSTKHAFVVSSHDTLPTRNVTIENIQLLDHINNYDPVVLVRTEGTTEPRGLIVRGISGGVINSLVKTDATLVPGGGGPETVLEHSQITPSMLALTADVVVNNTTTAVSLPSISARIAANEIVHFEWTCTYTSNPAADIRLSVTGPAGSTIEYGTPSGAKIGTTDVFTVQAVQAAAGNILAGGTGASKRTITIVGRIVNGSTIGPLSMRFAQGTADATDTTVHAGLTHVKLWRPLQ